jgi:hypothetical protein
MRKTISNQEREHVGKNCVPHEENYLQLMWGKKNLKYNHNRLVERSVHTNLEDLAAHQT